MQMQSVIVGWQIYELTKDPLSLGLIGLAEAVPFIIIAFFSGSVVDTFDRKKIILFSTLFLMLGSFLLFYFSLDISSSLKTFGTSPIYLVTFITGIARGFINPSYFAVLPNTVSRELLTNATTWSSSTFHIAAVIGPAAAGLMYGFFGVTISYACVLGFLCASLLFVLFIGNKPVTRTGQKEKITARLSAGLKFVFTNQIILSALSLDMFAVLFGGAVALLPIFADTILQVGPQGLGILRSAPAFGAIIMTGFLAYFPLHKNAGRIMLWAVAGFGVCMIAFALSTNFYLSVLILAISGMLDDVSVVIRQTVLQLSTPDEMRGRVAAVNGIFIGSSNEIGAFESGVAAKLMGLIPSVIFGGIMTIVTVAAVAKKAKKLRTLNLSSLQ